MKTYTHLCKEEQIVLTALLRQKLSLRQIAIEMKRYPATLSREIRFQLAECPWWENAVPKSFI
jgi:IS30 family transposase